MTALPRPPFTRLTAARKTRMSEDVWNTRDPTAVANTCTVDCKWSGRSLTVCGREAIETFLGNKWQRELEYRLIKEIWAFCDNRIAARFAYEWCDENGDWFRSYGNENWEFDCGGLLCHRIASVNDAPIKYNERKFDWPLGRRPINHPSLTELGL